MRIVRVLCALTALLGGILILGTVPDVAGAAGVQLIHNGGFETPLVPKGGYVVYPTGTTVGSWKVVGAPGNVGIVSTSYSSYGVTFDAHRSQQYLDLTGLSNTKTGVSQTVPTIVGKTYTLGFFSGNMYTPYGAYGTTSTINVYVGLTGKFSLPSTLSKTDRSRLGSITA